MNILIVDDREENLYLLESLFKANGHEIRQAVNGAEAVEIIQTSEVDLIISDILMPVMDGFQLCRKVKTDERFRTIPFIIYTATYTGPKDKDFAIKIGADRFVVKPCEPEVLMAAVNEVIASASRASSISDPPWIQEDEALKLYSERLVRKLEQKMLQAELEITKRQEAEDALKESEEKLRRITESAQDAIIMMDNLGNVSFWNESAERIFGYSNQEIMGKNLHTILTPERFHDTYLKPISYFKETGKGSHLNKVTELAGKKKDGTEFPIELSLSGVEIHGRWHAIGIVRDITDRKRSEAEQKEMEKKLQQNQRMEAIGTLAGGIAHDFNNILFPILGYAEMLLEDASADSSFKENLNQIHTSALRARELVKQILTFSRQERNELMLMKIQPIVKEALKLIRSTIPTTIDIKQDINPDCGIIKADPTQIHQIVMNLATNAYHAMEENGGELKVSLKEMEFGTLDPINLNMAPGVYACLTIADTGVGMDKNVTNKIFDPFFTTKAKGKGTGMGLSVVHGIVTTMGGAIHVYSEPGKGSEFHVYMPVEKSLSEKQATTSKAQIQGGTEQILLVDDEEAILTMEKRMLERLGYQVTSLTSSLEALEAFRDNPDKFDLVITDMAMPNMPGDKLAVELIKIRPDIPVLICTGFSENMSEENAASIGIKGFLMKPIVMKDLAQKIREVLN